MAADKQALYEKRFLLGTGDCDLNGAWKPASLLEAVQKATNEHCQSLRMWYNDLTERNLSWVISRTDIQTERYPKLGETVLIRTYMKGRSSFFCPRYSLIVDERGAVAARVGSLLMLVDRTTRKAVLPEDRGLAIPDAADLEPSVKITLKRFQLEGDKQTSEYTPQYADMDINGHVNSARYADWLCNALGFGVLKTYEIGSAYLNYRAEVLPGETVENALIRNGDAFRFMGSVNGACSFDIFGYLRRKAAEQGN